MSHTDQSNDDVTNSQPVPLSLIEPCVPLHRFSPQDLCNRIKEWVLNDIHYKSQLFRIKTIFCKHALSGKHMCELSTGETDSAKDTIHKYLSPFMTEATLHVVCQCYDQWQRKDHDAVQSKSAEEIADILYHYPLQQLLSRIERDSDPINGAQFMQLLHEKRDIIAEETGWDEDESYQIQSVLFRHHTFTKSEFIRHMNGVFNATSLPTEALQQMKQALLEYDVETVHYKIKHALPMNAFSDDMICMVDELMKDKEELKEQTLDQETDGFVQTIYESIAQCFIFDTTSCQLCNDDSDSHHPCLRLQHWICNNCGNCNVNSVINSQHKHKTICILCGISQRDQIIRKIKNYPTYRLIHQIKKNPRTIASSVNAAQEFKDTDSDPVKDSINETIRTASEHQSFDLSCPDQNNNDKCGAILRLTKILIKYKRWLYTIDQTKKTVDIEKTIQVNIPKYIDNKCFQTIFKESIKATALITVKQAKSLVDWIEPNDTEPRTLNTETFLSMDKQMFCEMLHEHAHTSIRFGGRMHYLISSDLKQTAKQHAMDIKHVSDDAFKAIFMAHLQRIQSQAKSLTKMFEDNAYNIADLDSFLALPKKRFLNFIQKDANVGTGPGARLHAQIKQVLNETASIA